MNKEISVLLPGSFFDEGYKIKLEYLSLHNIQCVYLFDHSINPSDDRKSMYEIKKAITLIQESNKYLFKLGLCVLNINKRKINLLFSEYINPMLEINNFRLGFGTGDNRFERDKLEYSHNLDSIIYDLVNQYTFSLEGKNLFVGGTSQKKLDLVKKYSVGINQWFGDEKTLISLFDNIGNTKPSLGRISHCQNINKRNSALHSNFEQIFVLKDSNTLNLNSQLDKISL